ncbi:MAG: right-handed parallel beta-helix repeat-containing protein [Clostridia bacterium]|nr:right-handed parallel beta-helix repeat-containing protein [Clostridia bacterium]
MSSFSKLKKAFVSILCLTMVTGSVGVVGSAANSITVCSADELLRAVESAENGSLIYLKGGTYRFDAPLSFDGIKKDITISSAPGETAVITNACPVSEWTECTVNGVKAFCASAKGKRISALFSESGKLDVTRLPESGYYYIDKPDLSDTKGEGNDLVSNGFYAHDLRKAPSNLCDVTVEILHQWVSEVEKPVSFNESTGLFRLKRYSGRPIEAGDRYFLQNALEGLDKPGEWCFDSKADKIYYVPFEGETANSLVLYASGEAQLMNIENSSGITFENIKFADTGWEYSNDKYLNMNIHTRLRDYETSSVQGAVDVCAAIDVIYSENISFKNCDFENIGATALRYFTGAKNCVVDSCYFGNIGANAIFIGGRYFIGEKIDEIRDNTAENITVRNCEIEKYGRQFFGACGIIVTYCDTALITNNEIHDGYYTGISAGFMWLFGENPTENIKITDNLIYNIGLETLSDLGGIYLLGVQQNTVVSGNVIHDCSCYDGKGGYAGNGIYLDSGCEFMTVENNLVFNCSTSCFNTTLSKNNIVRNNIFALSGQSVACLGAEEFLPYTNLNNTYINNIFLTDNKVLSVEEINHTGHFAGSGNILWDMTYGDELYFTIGSYRDKAIIRRSAEGRNILGSAIYRDPGFKDALSFDFSLDENSAAVKLGFEPFDYSQAGTLKDTRVGLTCEGGLTAYNADTEEYADRPATISFTEKIKLIFSKIIDWFMSSFEKILVCEEPEPNNLYVTDYKVKEKSAYSDELTALINKVKEHTPSYRVDKSRKPFPDDERIKAIYFDGEKCLGKDTEVFAYLGFPENASSENPVPAMVLVHGGGVHAQADWVRYWVDRGYAAISFDGFGQQPKVGYYSAAGNNNPDWTVNENSHLTFSNFDDVDKEYTEQWFYYYLADIVLSNNILRADNRVINNQIGVFGISWGSLVTTAAACYDSRFEFAIPIYGSGCWELMGTFFNNKTILEKWDPTPLLPVVKMPILFISSDEDPFFPADAPSSSAAVAKNGSVLLIRGLSHGDFNIEETVRFANEMTGNGDGNIRITGISEENGKITLNFNLPDGVKNPKVTLFYRGSPLEYDNLKLKESWSAKSAAVSGGKSVVMLPEGTTMYYIAVSGKTGGIFSGKSITASTGIYCCGDF